MSEVVFTGQSKPLAEHEFIDFERWLEARLPPKYRQFLARSNGGIPHKHQLPECYVQGFYSIAPETNELSLRSDIQKMAEDLPPSLIPIGYTGTGDRVCLSLEDEKIYLWEHELDYADQPPDLDELALLAEDIEVLLDSLEGDDEPCPDDETTNLGRWGDVGLLDKYLSEGHEINEVSANGTTLVRAAAYAKQLDFIKACVARGAILEGKGILHAAAFKGDVETVRYLLEQGLNPNEKDERGRTPLDCSLPPRRSLAADLLRSKGGVQTSNR